MKYFTTMLLAVALLASVIGCKSENFFPEKIILPLQKNNITSLELVRIDPGEFMMGTSPQNQSGMGNEKYKKASISSHFWIGKFEVTQEQ